MYLHIITDFNNIQLLKDTKSIFLTKSKWNIAWNPFGSFIHLTYSYCSNLKSYLKCTKGTFDNEKGKSRIEIQKWIRLWAFCRRWIIYFKNPLFTKLLAISFRRVCRRKLNIVTEKSTTHHIIGKKFCVEKIWYLGSQATLATAMTHQSNPGCILLWNWKDQKLHKWRRSLRQL